MAADTRSRLLDAALAVLAEDGVAGTSARSVGARAGVNPALIYYHFDSLLDLLSEAARSAAVARAEEYGRRLAGVSSLSELALVARQLHAEEQVNGNLAVLTQLLAGARTHPELEPVLRENFDLLTDAVTSTLEDLLCDSPLEDVLDANQLARTVSAGFIGVELLDVVGPADDEAMFDTLDQVAALVDSVLDSGVLAGGLIRRRLRTASAGHVDRGRGA